MHVNSTGGNPSNVLVSSLHRPQYERIAQYLEPVRLVADTVLFEAKGTIDHIYFPIGGIVALMVPLRRDRWVEVGVIGNVGAVGLCVVLGGKTANFRALVLQAGPAYRMTTEGYRASLELAPDLTPLLLRYVDAFLMQTSQTAACNGHHSFRQRMCRWLMIYSDLLECDELPIHQAQIARVLSVRIATVSEAFSSLRAARLISSAKGRLLIVDRPGMEAACCLCYGIIRERHVRLREEYRRFTAPQDAG